MQKHFFLKGFIEKRVEERTSFFTEFNLILYAFSVIVYALMFSLLINFYSLNVVVDFQFYLQVLLVSLIYFSVFLLLDTGLSYLFEIRLAVAHVISAKTAYFYNSALFVFPLLIFVTYSSLSVYALIAIYSLLLILSFSLTFINNKNLIISKLFYFILYICALKITPLLIIYKIAV